MRFFQNSPSIPDDLLIARDEGRVVFFCGAGVSRARAGLSDFFGLADDVIQRLGVPADSPACKILNEARELEGRTGVSGLIAADRVFGLLERDFLTRDIESAVAKALEPPPGVDLSAHRILLDLATTPEGRVRLVTTNFDRLFEDCDGALQVWKPPRLPDPSRQNDMDGIIHLHGRTAKDYGGSEGDGFVLSSSEFGRAYLSDGWATRFFREVLDRYVVVFVGYTADDPPVQYLLEALNNNTGRLDNVYAFQSGPSNEASARWHHKGIEAIAYDEGDGHQALWETLEAWARRAKAPEEWYKSVIDLAKTGPEQLQPHERGQVAHIISTLEGVRKFSDGDLPPPAEWLCVFDPSRRYAKPGHMGNLGEQGPFVDPFDLYGLDSDMVPNKIDPEDHYEKRDIPPTAWDAFAAYTLDRQNLRDDSIPAIRGYWARRSPRLPSRLEQIGVWIAKVAHQPASVWWAAHQFGLHADIKQRIQSELERSQDENLRCVREAWGYLFEVWENRKDDFNDGWYNLEAIIRKDGWNSATIRRYAAIDRPILKAERNRWGGPKPPERIAKMRIGDLLDLHVEYAAHLDGVKIPDKWLAFAIRELRKNLELALDLETELGSYGLSHISPIVPDDDPSIDRYQRTHGLSGSVIRFSSNFSRLVEFDATAAYREFSVWPNDDDAIFSRLRIWACGKAALISKTNFGPVIASLGDETFWNSYHERDLLLVLAKRWQDLSDGTRKEIENRLLEGPPRWKDENEAEFDARRAWGTLNRITWMASGGCHFTFNLETETERLRSKAPRWRPKYAAKAAGSMGVRSGWVKTETEHNLLLAEPLNSTLSKALELSGRTEDFLTKRDPFAGLCAERPVRALAALINAAGRDEYPEWAWRTFLDSEARTNDKPKFSALVAEQISKYPDGVVIGFLNPAANWVLKASNALASHFPQSFDKVMSKLTNVSRGHPSVAKSAIVRGNKEPDWTMEAINSPIGKIAQALFNDPRKEGLKARKGFPTEWLAYVNGLISLCGDMRRHALVIFAHNLNWFYAIDPKWAQANLLSVLEGDDQGDRNAVWSGFFWGAKVPNQDLYMRMKPSFLTLATERSLSRRGHCEVLAGIILAGWSSPGEKTGERCISNKEMRDVLLHADDEFRVQVLWQAEKWSGDQAEDVNQKWSKMLPELLRDVWPRQQSAKSSKISAQLCALAFSSVQRFPGIAETILPLLTAIDRDSLVLINLRKSENDIVRLYPRQTLAILHAVLPDNVAAWPYGIEGVLQQLGDADASLKLDERLLELKRKWNSR